MKKLYIEKIKLSIKNYKTNNIIEISKLLYGINPRVSILKGKLVNWIIVVRRSF